MVLHNLLEMDAKRITKLILAVSCPTCGAGPDRSANYTAVNLGLPLTVTDVWKQPTSKRRSCTNCLPRGDRAVIEVVLQPIPKRFSDVIDKLPPGSWVALTPDRKLVAGMGATKKRGGSRKCES